MPLALSFVLIGFFIWIAENIATYFGAWKYPNQTDALSLVHVGKVSSWLLLVIVYIIFKRCLKIEIKKEVLKGHIDTLLLSLLKNRIMYGYELAKMVREISNNQFELKEATLYLSLKRLKKTSGFHLTGVKNRVREKGADIIK